MFRTKLRHKVSGEELECIFKFGKNGEHIFFNPKLGKNIDNPSDYYEIPYTPYELYGIECRSGWKELYEPILKYVDEYNQDKKDKDKLIIRQIKEKWAHLEMSFNFFTDELREMVGNAYVESENICEDCGSKDNVGIALGGWKHTICLKCLTKEIQENKTPCIWKRSFDKKNFLVKEDGSIKEVEENVNDDIY